jgi:hypothetical protein
LAERKLCWELVCADVDALAGRAMAEMARFQYALKLLNVDINLLRIYLTVKSKTDAVIKKLKSYRRR